MRIILLGPPGAGKGTQAQFICKRFAIPQIATGDMLRAAAQTNTTMGTTVKKIMASGGLVSDDLIIALIKERILATDCKKGFLLDGFPRTYAQAEALKLANIKIDYVIALDVPFDLILERITGRLIHSPSGRSYHSRYNPPQRPGLDDETGEPLIERKDDTKSVVAKRLAVYQEQTAPLIVYYKNWSETQDALAPIYHAVAGVGDTDEVAKRIIAIIHGTTHHH